MNVLWTKPHVIAFGELLLQPGEPGNVVTQAQLARLKEFPLFNDCVAMKQIVVRPDASGVEAPKAVVAASVDTGDADKVIAAELAAKKAEEDRVAAEKGAGTQGDKAKGTPPAGEAEAKAVDGKKAAGTQGDKAKG